MDDDAELLRDLAAICLQAAEAVEAEEAKRLLLEAAALAEAKLEDRALALSTGTQATDVG